MYLKLNRLPLGVSQILRFTALLIIIAATPILAQAAAPQKLGSEPTPSTKLMPGVEPFQVRTSSGVVINGVIGGSGPPVLLLHGAPVNLVGWRTMAPALAKKYTVVATDLRGYGDSDMPDGGDNHANYAKRAMAQDQVDAMTALGFDRFHVVGHDRGGRVGHRLARDHQDKVITLTVMDIMPTLHLYENVDRKFAEAYWFWVFLTAAAPVPETFISGNSRFFMDAGMVDARKEVEDAVFENFVRTMSRKGAAQAEDCRAAATIDLEPDRADWGRKLPRPLLVLWGDHNALNKGVVIVSIWRERAANVRGAGTPSGHWMPAQIPDQLGKEVSASIDENS